MTSPDKQPKPTFKATNDTVEKTKHVHFPQHSESSSSREASVKPYSRRIVLGGRNNNKAKPMRDVGIFIAVLAILLFSSRNFEITSSSNTDDETIIPEDPFANKLNKIANEFAKLIQSDLDSKSFRNEPCDVFLRLGSIPHTGYSLFAGRNYTTDEMVPIPGLQASRWLPVPNANNDGSQWNVATHGFLLKHHPYRSNVQGLLVTETDVTQSVSVRATRDIRQGEELYVDFQQHPANYLTHNHHFFDSIPSTQHHEIATEIRRDVEATGKRLVQGKRKKSIRINPAPILALIQRSMEKVHPQVAALLHHENMYEPFLHHHQMSSFCPSDLVVAEASRVRTRYAVIKGETLTVIPLHHWSSPVRPKGENESSDWALHCVSIDKQVHTDWYCPLTISAQQLIQAPKDDSSFINVELQWVEHTDELQDLYAWNVVALDDLAAGTELQFPNRWQEKLFE